MIEVGIVGGAGYTAGELIRILLHHPQVKIDFVFSTSNAGNLISDVHRDLYADTDIRFSDKVNPDADVVFLCLGHGNSTRFLQDHPFSETTKIIDLSNDFRLQHNRRFDKREFVYGLPELHKKTIQNATNIANPGCFATAIQLATLPLAAANLLTDTLHVNAVTGATGAGTALSATTHFTWRDNNFSSYKVFEHQHLDEIEQSLEFLQDDFDTDVVFIPNRGNFSRGIYATVYTEFYGSLEEAQEIYREFYKDAAFTYISEKPVFLKQVVNTNKCLLHLHKHQNRLLITSVIDNLLKGASGQAVQNMNLMYGLDEDSGLHLKANYF